MLFSAFILPLALAATTAEVAAWTEADYRTNRVTTLVGQVLATNGAYVFLEDESGRISFFAKEPPAPGELVRADCFGSYSSARQRLLVTRRLIRLGTAPLKPPRPVSIAEIQQGRCDYALIQVSGEIVDVIPDEIDPANAFLTLSDGYETVQLAASVQKAAALLGARVSVTGYVQPNLGGWRLFIGRGITAFNRRHADYISVLSEAPQDPFSARPLADLSDNLPRNLAALGSRRITGRVIAVWHRDRLMLDTGPGPFKTIHANLEPGLPLPAVGEDVETVGFPQTDFFSITLTHARWRPAAAQAPARKEERTQALTARQLLTDARGNRQIQVPYHGRTVRIRGIARNVPTTDLNDNRLMLQDGDFVIPVDASSCPEAFRDVTPGCEIEVTGVCLLMADSWRHDRPVPSVHGLALILRSGDDLRILARPPWWTPARLLIVLGVLLAITVFFFVWNRILRHLVIRRSRELAREQIAREILSVLPLADNSMPADKGKNIVIDLGRFENVDSVKLDGISVKNYSMDNYVLTVPCSRTTAHFLTVTIKGADGKTALVTYQLNYDGGYSAHRIYGTNDARGIAAKTLKSAFIAPVSIIKNVAGLLK